MEKAIANYSLPLPDFTITDVGSDWLPTEVQQIIEHEGRREKKFSQIGVRLTPTLAAQRGVPTSGHPHAPHSARLVGWGEPAANSSTWTFKVDVYEQRELTLEVVQRQGRNIEQVDLLASDLQEGEGQEFTWDATGVTILPGKCFVRLTTLGPGGQPLVQRRPLIEH